MKRILIALWLSACLASADSNPASPVAEKFLQLFDRLRQAQGRTDPGRPHVSFQLSADEINQYMNYALRTTPRPGVESVKVKIFAHNYISTFTVVDFDAVERARPGTVPSVLRPMLHGKKPIWVDCRFQTTGAAVGFSVEKAYYDNIRLPAFFVEKMIQSVAARQPEKYDTSKPVPLPFGLRKLWTVDQIILGEN
jgi:hypothetical protein